MIYNIKIDLDGKAYKRRFSEIAKRLVFLKRVLNVPKFTIEEKETKHGYHIVVKFSSDLKLDNKDIVILQLILMSDWKREVFNWLRVIGNLTNWNVLFNKKYRLVNNKLKEISTESNDIKIKEI